MLGNAIMNSELCIMSFMRPATYRDDRRRKGEALAPTEEASLRTRLQPLEALPSAPASRNRLQQLEPCVSVACSGGAEAPPFQPRVEGSDSRPRFPEGMNKVAGSNAPGSRNPSCPVTPEGSRGARGVRALVAV